MSWMNRLGKSLNGKIQKLGDAASHTIDKAARLTDHVAPAVEKIAGAIGNAAAVAIPFTAEIPGVGEAVAGAAAVGKGVAAGAKLAQSAAKSIERTAKQTIKAGMDLSANPNLADAKRYGGTLSSIVRHSASNIADARSRASKIRGMN